MVELARWEALRKLSESNNVSKDMSFDNPGYFHFFSNSVLYLPVDFLTSCPPT